MKTISQIRKELDEMNRAIFTEQSKVELGQMEVAWVEYSTVDLGEMRQVIEDRFQLAHSRRRRAGL